MSIAAKNLVRSLAFAGVVSLFGAASAPAAPPPTDAVGAYYRGEYAEAATLLKLAPAASGGEGVRLYRLYFALRASDADPALQRAARRDAAAALRADFDRLPSPSSAHYLTVLGSSPAARPERIHRWLAESPEQWSRFETTKLLQIAASAGIAPTALLRWVDRLISDPAYFAEPYSDELFRVLPEIDLGAAQREALETRLQSSLADTRDAQLSWIGYLVATDRSAEARIRLDRLTAQPPQQSDWSPASRERWVELLDGAGRPGDALPFAERLAADRGFSRDWLRVGRIRSALGDGPGAREAYVRCLKRNPGEISHQLEFARVLMEQGRPEEAERNYRRAAAAALEFDDPFRAHAQLSLALFLENQDRFREALAVARAIAQGTPQAAGALRIQARAHWHLGEYERVLKLTGQAIDRGAQDAALWHLRALAFRDRGVKGDAIRALAAIDAALVAAPGVRAYRVQRVEMLWSAKQGDQAIELQRVLLAEDGHDLPGWQRLGRMLVSHPLQLEEAAQAYRKALEYYPEDPELWQRLMQTLSLLREREQRIRS